jgi:cellulose synthase/poly-beta-1,6-N-acetylglucosamine synthase-like glycosyltransferase/spore germination protein YaaH/peptidoglycan/xylan/chitin deacetylase (PgdA/CDA1 family)
MNQGKPIFYDEQRRRWRRTRRLLEITGAVFTVVLVVFFFTVLERVELPQVLLPNAHASRRGFLAAAKAKAAPPKRKGRHERVAELGQVPANYDPLRIAFYVSWDPSSLASLQQHYRDIDLLVPEQLHSVTANGRLDTESDPKLMAWQQSVGVNIPTMPLLNNSDGTLWRIQEMADLLRNPDARQKLVQSVVAHVVDANQSGVALDFEQVPDKSQHDFVNFVGELAAGLHGADLKLMVALPAADWSYNYTAIGQLSDAIILMNYDDHWLTSKPGPIAPQDWYANNIAQMLKRVPADKLIMGIANYAYDWPDRGGLRAKETSTVESFEEAVVASSESDAKVQYDPDSLNPHYSYYDEQNHVHEVWMLDGVTAYNELAAADRAGVRGTALWRFGTEDPSLWSVWDNAQEDEASRNKLVEMPPGDDLILEGSGDIWHISSTPTKGQRTFRYDAASGNIVDEAYLSLPFSYRIEQLGAVPKKIALSFDDGPDPRNTPQILDILKEKHVPATFFVIGSAANDSLGLLKREYQEGHEIGNHTYTHPKADDISKAQFELELNLTERLFSSTLGIKTRLFRPPYGIDHQPEVAAEVASLPQAESMGYLLVGAQIDPHDWGEPGGVPPAPASVIVQRVLDQAGNGGHIVLLHDGGGDRSGTIQALPQIIDRMRAEGFQFVLASDLIGQSRAQVMIPLTTREAILAQTDALIFDLYGWARLGFGWIFIIGIALVSGRALIVGLLALIEKLCPPPPEHPDFLPQVSVLIPAYNEEEVIVKTVQAALASDYHDLEVVVIDDGSSDRTGELLDNFFGNDPRVRIIHQPNRGKSAALTHGLREASSKILVTIDADTAIAPQAISRLVRHFADPHIGAVAGNVKVGNRHRWLTRWQALEYITSQNLEKRAFHLLDCIPVVPGALSAWRAEAIDSAGGFTSDTVAEDTDLTIAVRRVGWRIVYDEDAIGWTEAPESADALIRQRFRWTFGTLQSFWKHRDTLGRPRYGALGFVALPNIFLFQLLLPLFSPIIDLLFVGSLLLWGLGQFHVTYLPQLWTTADVERSVAFFLGFMVIDLLTCVIAFCLEKNEDWSLLWPLLLQRFYYRQMMYVVLFRAVKHAVEGRAVGWRGVEPEKPVPVTFSIFQL